MKNDLRLDSAAPTEAAALRLWAARPAGRGLTAARVRLVAASVAAASGRRRLLGTILHAARAAREPRVRCVEALLQTYLFAGYPRAIEALDLLAQVWPGRTPGRRVPESAWTARGLRLCRRVYGDRFERMEKTIARAHPDLRVWMIREGYGKVLSRPGLDPVTRELCAVGVLTALAAPRQLAAHIRGAHNVGAPARAVLGAVKLGALGCGVQRWRRTVQAARNGWPATADGGGG